MTHPSTTDPRHPDHNAAVLQDDAPRAGATPLLWLLLLLAVAAFAWWQFASRDNAAPAPATDLAIIEGTATEVALANRKAPDSTPADSAPSSRRSSQAASSSAPQLLSAALPRYPAEERRRGVQGDVTLRIDVGANGVPTDVDYAHRSGNRALDRAAMTAAHNWRFQPAIRNGEAVASTVNVPVAFRL